MTLWRRTTACERAAQWISLELDDELAELERAALDRHLGRCAACRAVRAEIVGFTTLLRAAAPLELVRPDIVESPPRPRVNAVAKVALAACVTLAVVVAGLVVRPESRTPTTSALVFRSTQQQRRFGQEHVRIEPVVFHVAPLPAAPPFGWRALL